MLHERFLASIVESAQDAIFGKTLDGQILSWNAGAERIYGYRPEEIIGDTVFRLAPPDRHPGDRGFLARMKRGERVDLHETVRVRKNGELFPISLAISPVRDDNGVIVGSDPDRAREPGYRRRAGPARPDRSAAPAVSP